MFNLIKRLKVRERIDNRVKNKSIQNAHRKHLKCFSDDYEEINKIIENFRGSGGLKHEFQLYKLWELQKYLTKYKPKKLLSLEVDPRLLFSVNILQVKPMRELVSPVMMKVAIGLKILSA